MIVANARSAVRALRTNALRSGLTSFAVDSVSGAGLHVYEERPQAIVEAVRRVRQAQTP